MTDSAPAHQDRDLFLTHFTRGREAYDAGRFDEAERELEEAYLLRPRDQKVLNVLGLVYFKLERLDKAEEVYRKLAADSPEAHTLHYNLGLIHFKLGRLDESESAFLKALELAGENPKIRFYLGSIYERLRRYQDAIYQYRQAGAHIMVRRVEHKLAFASSRAKPAGSTQPVAVAGKDPDTARFRTADVREALSRAEKAAAAAAPPKRVEPVGSPLLAEDAPAPGPKVTADTARFRLPDGEARPGEPATPAAHESLRALENHLMEVDVAGKVFIRPGTLYSYSGALTFWVKERRSGGHPGIAAVTGKGRLILKDKERNALFLRIEGEPHCVEPEHLLACEATLAPRFISVGEGPAAVDFVLLEGRGLAALSVASKPLTLMVTPELPACVPASGVITWNGSLLATPVDDERFYEAAGAQPERRGPWLRIEGSGRVLVEHVQE